MLRWIAVVVLAYGTGKLVSRIKLPSILGWLLAGMVFGPHAVNLLPHALMEAPWYENVIRTLECAVGLMIGTELVWDRLRQYGRALMLTTLFQSVGTFAVVSAAFAAAFSLAGIPAYLAFIFGAIALATAPAPALSIVREFRTSGPVTGALIPIAALDDIVGVVIFFVVIALVIAQTSTVSLPAYIIPVMIFLPLLIGVVTGIPAGLLLRKYRRQSATLGTLVLAILATALLGFACNTYLMPAPVLNFMLMGMAFSATFSNLLPEERLEQVIQTFNPILGLSMIVVIVNLGAPLDYRAIMGAGGFTVIYIVARAVGKYFGARLGAELTGLPPTVQKYLGLTLLPHSGVSLVFTGIAVSALSKSVPDYAKIVQGTIAAAAVINEILAVVMAQKAFEWAGELGDKPDR